MRLNTQPSLRSLLVLMGGMLTCLSATSAWCDDPSVPPLKRVFITSSLDQTKQPSVFWAPPATAGEKRPLLLFLHSWSGNYLQNNSKWHQEAVRRGWIFLQPNFRGANNTAAACGSELARQDVIDALDWVIEQHSADTERIYLAGSSGGGHMAMLLAGYHPQRFSAVSAWVGISDLTAWYEFHVKNGKPQRYAQMIAACTGGPPHTSPEIDAQYRARSPIDHLKNAAGVPIDLHAGIRDGYSGSVPVDHTLNAFNELAKANRAEPISAAKIDQLVTMGRTEPVLETQSVDRTDQSYARPIHFRKIAGPVRVTIFEGGHESLPETACDWLAKHRRPNR